ncbi:MAG: rRNA maturation RNase YbeY [Burkholderiales bacterium]|nr:rRNA maturation RNase YbeY [Burkholderiales bacterium]MCW5604832.1 rRNA maturation RNase YbeY [Burkholderiales bacterium]
MSARRRAPRIDVQCAATARNVPAPARIRQWARAALPGDARVTIRIVGRAEGRLLNRSYRNRDYATNVLTFVFRDRPPYEGDIALCAPVITREARAQRKTVAAHYAHMVVHGLLHLQGYDHENDADAALMERREKTLLARFGYPDPYRPDPARGA